MEQLEFSPKIGYIVLPSINKVVLKIIDLLISLISVALPPNYCTLQYRKKQGVIRNEFR